jgi:hypothetical protein
MNDDDSRCSAGSDPGAEPPGERERAIRQVSERIAAAAAQRAGRPVAGEPVRDATPKAKVGPTLQSLPAWVGPPANAGPSPAPAPSPAPPASPRPVTKAPAFLMRTAPLSPEARGLVGAGPFAAAAAAQPQPRRPAPRTVQSRAVGVGGTTPVGDDSIEKAVAAVRSRPELPDLTLRQFASLCAELAFRPTGRGAILERYGVRDEATLAALDAHWRRERAARPEARTAFADDFATHLAWLHTQYK